jgi:hypothetical protein
MDPMSPDLPEHPGFGGATRDEIFAALFVNMVSQQSNMALMFLGRIPHPETGEVLQDLEAAKMFIDQLEMLEAKTRNNLSKQEDRLLKQSLSVLQLEFAQAVDRAVEPGSHPAAPPTASSPTAKPQPLAPEPAPAAAEPAKSQEEAESRKKFSKKY